MSYLELIINSFVCLKEDFIGFTFDIYGVWNKALQFVEVFLLFALFYFLGRIFLRKFFNNFLRFNYSFFLCIAIGYIIVASWIFLLGFVGFLYPSVIIVSLCIFYFIAIIDLLRHKIKLNLNRSLINFNPYKYLLFSFILISFLRMLPPQSAGDPLDYHLRFPRIYLEHHSMMIPALGDESYTNVPQLPEMLFVISQIFTNGEGSRIIHFAFFVLICLLLYNSAFFNENKRASYYSSLLFASSPLVLELSYQAFSDYPAILCFILAFYILLKDNKSKKGLILAGTMFGGALASKLWILLYFPFVFFFIAFFIGIYKKEKLRNVLYFLLPIFILIFFWYLRGILIVGNPFYVNTDQGREMRDYSIAKALYYNLLTRGFFSRFVLPLDFGVLYIVGLISAIYFYFKNRVVVRFEQIVLAFMVIAIALFLPYSIASGRYTIGYMIFVFVFAGLGLAILEKIKIAKIFIFFYFLLILIYFTINTIPVLPYGLGWADKTKYLKRELLKDYASYYDFNGEFDKNIDADETIITYNVFEMYYATFKYKNAYYFINQNKYTIDIPIRYKKILIRGGDFNWFCKQTKLVNCIDYEVRLITFDEKSKQYLYEIKRK